ncbi:hypothetical protein [Labilibaculum sp.]|uniref:hypothetical protein n=1 Tax=Labilibaculum sp. TaxID=2060723 RepID=UPI002AA79167|nr:hypothetical protein [Labilibaculum sp.]
MDSEQIINQEAYELGKQITGSDRVLIQTNLGITESTVNVVLSGKRRAIRGKAKEVIEMAKKIAKINDAKADLF